MKKNLLICCSLLAASSSWAATQNHLYILGGETELVDVIDERFGDTRVHLSDSESQYQEIAFSPKDYLYINGSSELSFTEQLIAQKAFNAKTPIITDLTGVYDNAEAVSITQTIGGLGFSAPIVIISKKDGRTHYAQLGATDSSDTPINDSPATQYQAMQGTARDIFLTRLIESIDEATPSKKKSANSRALMAAKSTSSTEPYAPFYSYTITTNKIDVNCNLPVWFYNSTSKNYCNGSMQLAYTVDLMRSIRGNVNGKATEDAKFVRVSIDAENGGAGIRVSDALTREHPWWQSYVNYDETLGGFAEKYKFSISPTQDVETITLRSHAPANKNPEYEKREVTSTTLGFSGTAGGEGGTSDGGSLKASASATASFSTTSSRWFTVINNEYEIVNKTSGNTARFEWDHNTLDREDYFVSNLGEHTLFQVWNTLFDTSHFSALSHQNFVPGFQATYRVASKEIGTRSFTIMSDVHPAVVYGKDQYWVFSHLRDAFALNRINQTHYQTFSVDFSHPVFAPQPTVYLQNLGHNDRVLNVSGTYRNSSGAPVITYPYHGNRNQLWGFDSKGRYASRTSSNFCLTVEYDLSVTNSTCGMGLNQQWYWEGDKMFSRFIGQDPNTQYVLQMGSSNSAAEAIVVPSSAASASASRWQPVLADYDL